MENNNIPLYIGITNTYKSFYGKMDELRFWNSALDISDIRKNMHNTLNGYENDLISYWQFENLENEYTVFEPAGSFWLRSDNFISSSIVTESPIIVGIGETDENVVSNTGNYTFGNPETVLNFTQKTGVDTFYVTRIDTVASNIPSRNDETFYSNRYWIIDKYGNGTFNADVAFPLYEDISSVSLEQFKLYKRNIYPGGNWYSCNLTATSKIANESTVIFSGITETGQYMIAREDKSPELKKLVYPFTYLLRSENYSKINAGSNAKP
jgi:hypothetical protein